MNNIDEKPSPDHDSGQIEIGGMPLADLHMIAEVWAQQLRNTRTLVDQSTWSADAKQRWNEDVLPVLAYGVALCTSSDTQISTPLSELIEDAIDHPTAAPAEIQRWTQEQTSGNPHQIMATVPIW